MNRPQYDVPLPVMAKIIAGRGTMELHLRNEKSMVS
jgi:hypothetical protein